MKSKQYTILKKESITLSDLAKKLGLSRKLIFTIMEEKNLISVSQKKTKRLTNPSYGYTTEHHTRTAIYIYTSKIEELTRVLKIPNIEQDEKMCLRCREVKHVKKFNERGASCKVCLNNKAIRSTWEICDKDKIGIDPYFLRRGLKYD